MLDYKPLKMGIVQQSRLAFYEQGEQYNEHTNLKNKFMQTLELIQEIQRLPLTKKFYVVEETIKSIKNDEMNQQMELAVNELYGDYCNNKELTAFTSLDLEHFYEAK